MPQHFLKQGTSNGLTSRMCPKSGTCESWGNEIWRSCGCFSGTGSWATGLVLGLHDLHFQYSVTISQPVSDSLISFSLPVAATYLSVGKKREEKKGREEPLYTLPGTSHPLHILVICPVPGMLSSPTLPPVCFPWPAWNLLYTPPHLRTTTLWVHHFGTHIPFLTHTALLQSVHDLHNTSSQFTPLPASHPQMVQHLSHTPTLPMYSSWPALPPCVIHYLHRTSQVPLGILST